MVRWKKIAAILAPVLLLSACGSTQSASSANDSSAGPNAVISVNGTEPQVSLVPMNTGEVGGDRILSAILAGLVAYDPSGKPVNEVAESITPNSDATQFTVKIKDGWKFTDGTPVTSESFTKAWSYAANVTNAQLNSSYFSIVKGYDELQKEGTPSDAQLSGLVVKDDHTFQINLNAPDSAPSASCQFRKHSIRILKRMARSRLATVPISSFPGSMDRARRSFVTTITRATSPRRTVASTSGSIRPWTRHTLMFRPVTSIFWIRFPPPPTLPIRRIRM